MLDGVTRQGALAHLAERTLSGPGYRLRDVPHTAKIVLRGNPEDAGFAGSVADVLALRLPTTPNRAVRGPTATALWLGPDEWLVVSGPGAEASLVQGLEEVLEDRHASVVDISDARTVFRLSGSAVRDILARGCALDLHPRVFDVDDTAQTLLAKADVLIHQIAGDDDPAFDIYVARSFADYLWRWLLDAVATVT